MIFVCKASFLGPFTFDSYHPSKWKTTAANQKNDLNVGVRTQFYQEACSRYNTFLTKMYLKTQISKFVYLEIK